MSDHQPLSGNRLRSINFLCPQLESKLIVDNIKSSLHVDAGGFLTEVEMINVFSGKTRVDHVRALLDVLKTKDNHAFGSFCTILEAKAYGHWSRELKIKAGLECQDITDSCKLDAKVQHRLLQSRKKAFKVVCNELDDPFEEVLESLRNVLQKVFDDNDFLRFALSFESRLRDVIGNVEFTREDLAHPNNLMQALAAAQYYSKFKLEALDVMVNCLVSKRLTHQKDIKGIMDNYKKNYLKPKMEKTLSDFTSDSEICLALNPNELNLALVLPDSPPFREVKRAQEYLIDEMGIKKAENLRFDFGCLYILLTIAYVSNDLYELLERFSCHRQYLEEFGIHRVLLVGYWSLDLCDGTVVHMIAHKGRKQIEKDTFNKIPEESPSGYESASQDSTTDSEMNALGITGPRRRDERSVASKVEREDSESKTWGGLKRRKKPKVIEPNQPDNKSETKTTSLQLRKQNAVDVFTELDETINIFNHKAYTVISCLDYIITLLVFLIILIFTVTAYKFYLEEATCGFPTASLNLASRMLTHVVLPSYFLYHLSVLNNEPLKKLKFLRLAGKRSYSPVIQQVIMSLSTLSEKKELEGRSLVEQINFTLNKKLTLVMGTSTLLSVVYFLHILFLGAPNFKTFSASSISISNVCISVITLAAFIIHCTTGTVFCFYLFEMRGREYCSHILRTAGKRKDNLRANVEAVKSAILARWRNFRQVMFAASSVYLTLLLVSIFTATPFHCHGEKVEFTKLEWNQIRASWTFHMILGFICHVAVYNYFNFVKGRYIAMMLQVFYFILGFFDPHGPKWTIMIQITNVIYPISSLLSFHILACHNIWNREKHHRRKMNTITILSEALKRMIFSVHFVFVLLHFVAVVIAIYNEYRTLEYSKVS